MKPASRARRHVMIVERITTLSTMRLVAVLRYEQRDSHLLNTNLLALIDCFGGSKVLILHKSNKICPKSSLLGDAAAFPASPAATALNRTEIFYFQVRS